MKTEDLITRLTAETAAPQPLQGSSLLLRGALSGLPVLAALLLVLGLRPDLGPILQTPVGAMKFLLPAAISICAGAAVLRLMRPEGRLGGLAPALIVLALAAILPGLWRLTHLPKDQILTTIMGQTAPQCLIFLMGIAAAPVITLLHGLTRGASTRPGLSGGLAGLAAGAASATGYALHCPEDDPAFFVVWYMGAMLLAALIAAGLGRRALRW